MKFRISLALTFIVLLFSGCSEDWALKEETFSIAEENSDWLPAETDENSFIMTDNLGITHGFVIQGEEHYLDKSWGGFLGLNTHMTFTEYRYRAFGSTYGLSYYAALRATTWEPYGDHLSIEVDEISFKYDLGLHVISHLRTPTGTISKVETSEGYSPGEDIMSTCEILDSLTVNDRTYFEVIYFTLNDFSGNWNDFTVREIYFAKEYGLIKFLLNDGTCYLRN